MASTNAGKKLYIYNAPQQKNLTLTQINALTAANWIEIGGVGNHGETGVNTNILTYDTWGESVVQKAKGMSDAGSPEIEVARTPGDAGQAQLREAAKTNLNWLFRVTGNDPQTLSGTPTIIYNRGLVSGPRRPNGRNEDFDLEVYTLGLQQLEIIVDPT